MVYKALWDLAPDLLPLQLISSTSPCALKAHSLLLLGLCTFRSLLLECFFIIQVSLISMLPPLGDHPIIMTLVII